IEEQRDELQGLTRAQIRTALINRIKTSENFIVRRESLESLIRQYQEDVVVFRGVMKDIAVNAQSNDMRQEALRFLRDQNDMLGLLEVANQARVNQTSYTIAKAYIKDLIELSESTQMEELLNTGVLNVLNSIPGQGTITLQQARRILVLVMGEELV